MDNCEILLKLKFEIDVEQLYYLSLFIFLHMRIGKLSYDKTLESLSGLNHCLDG